MCVTPRKQGRTRKGGLQSRRAAATQRLTWLVILCALCLLSTMIAALLDPRWPTQWPDIPFQRWRRSVTAPAWATDRSARLVQSPSQARNRFTYLRLINAVYSTGNVLAPYDWEPGATADEAKRQVLVRSVGGSSVQSVTLTPASWFYGNGSAWAGVPLRACDRYEWRTAVLLMPTHFGLRNFAHATFDLTYPLYSTLMLLAADTLRRDEQNDPTLYPLPVVLILDMSSLQRSGFPPVGGRERLARLMDLFRPLVQEVVVLTADGIESRSHRPYRTCFRDLVLGAREQPLRNKDWFYVLPDPEGSVDPHLRWNTDALRGSLMRGMTRAMHRFFRRTCNATYHRMAERTDRSPRAVIGRTSRRRRLMNAEQLARALSAEYLDHFGDSPWCEQFATIHQRRALVAMHGAEWSHLFSLRDPEHALTVEVFPPQCVPPTFFGAMAQWLGVPRHGIAQVENTSAAVFTDEYWEHVQCRKELAANKSVPKSCWFQANLVMEDKQIAEIREWLDGNKDERHGNATGEW
ncbi:hypothetical protein CDCA_CDCA10G2971 [Cyanidium caldarium]|uniref:Uncharacterized protein n=1 Tax=Cyanidium caldarium TaxID=2771 RepID=A0AAV9IXS0_CYACA|nr:hypothetical protein CDCA_CDCA10G2971 [Cyanidium caldarium]